MKIALLIIGDELLDGSILDTNSQFLSKKLFEEGFSVEEKRTVSDNAIQEALSDLLKKYDCIITSGGLGPTHDDKTVDAISSFCRVPLVASEEVRRDLEMRYPKHLKALEKQIYVPKGCHLMQTFMGTAPSWALLYQGKKIIVLPGVPDELKEAFTRHGIPFLKKDQKGSVFSERIDYCHTNENEIDPLLVSLERPNVSLGIYPGSATVSVILRGTFPTKEAFNQAIEPMKEALEKLKPTALFTSKGGRIEEAVHEALIKRGESLAIAESCTGGLLTAKLTQFRGASTYLLAGLVTYANAAKVEFLGLSPERIEEIGAVNEETVEKMCEGLFAKTTADWVLAVSGIAGPDGGSSQKPVGTIFGALGKRGEGIWAGRIPMQYGRSREWNQERAASYMLGVLWRKCIYDVEPVYDHE